MKKQCEDEMMSEVSGKDWHKLTIFEEMFSSQLCTTCFIGKDDKKG